MQFIYEKTIIDADFSARAITIRKRGSEEKPVTHQFAGGVDLIRTELLAFIDLAFSKNSKNKDKKNKAALKTSGMDKQNADGVIGTRIVSIAEKGIPKPMKRPRIAVIGGGIFGTSAAAELGEFSDVTLFEKNEAMLQEATLVNCFRHHHGFHYPRSDETVRDIQTSRADFERHFGDAIDTFPTYYGLAKEGSFVSTKEFIEFCQRNNLSYEETFPGEHVFNKDEIEMSIKVAERSYHHGRLKDLVEKRLDAIPNVKVLLNTKVIDTELKTDGTKKVTYLEQGKKKKTEEFDYIVNATYANINSIAHWMNFEHRPIRVDLAEVVVLRLPIEPMSLTIIDGPFATLMSTGNPQEFTLYHVVESILDRYVPKKGLPKSKQKRKTNAKRIFQESLRWFPILKDAEIIGSRIVNRGVQAYREHDDARVAELIEHGFGCWSILSGKILSSVTLAKRLAETIYVGNAKVDSKLASKQTSQNAKRRAHPLSRKSRK